MLPCTRGKYLHHSKVQTRFDRRLSTIGKSLRFTIPHSKANNKSKSVWWSIHPAPKSLPCIRFSESRILTLGHPHKHCRISLVHERSSDKSNDSASWTNIYRFFTTLRFSYAPKKAFAETSFLLQKDSTWSLLVPGSVGFRHTWGKCDTPLGSGWFLHTRNKSPD